MKNVNALALAAMALDPLAGKIEEIDDLKRENINLQVKRGEIRRENKQQQKAEQKRIHQQRLDTAKLLEEELAKNLSDYREAVLRGVEAKAVASSREDAVKVVEAKLLSLKNQMERLAEKVLVEEEALLAARRAHRNATSPELEANIKSFRDSLQQTFTVTNQAWGEMPKKEVRKHRNNDLRKEVRDLLK